MGGKGLVLWAGRGLRRKQEGGEEWIVKRKKRILLEEAGRKGVRKLAGRKGRQEEWGVWRSMGEKRAGSRKKDDQWVRRRGQ